MPGSSAFVAFQANPKATTDVAASLEAFTDPPFADLRLAHVRYPSACCDYFPLPVLPTFMNGIGAPA